MISANRARWTLPLLVAVYTLGFVDRQIINILAEPIKRDLLLSDAQLGALTGLAFALLYTLLGLPIASYADRHHRPRVIATCLSVWSLFTAMSAAAGGFVSLFLMRVGVGVGEAGCSPPAVSLIADTVPRERRARAMGFYALGNPLGSLLGLAVGGLVAASLGWRAAFLLVGLPGLLLAVIVVALVPEPREVAPAPAAGPRGADFIAILRKPTFWFAGLGAAAMAFVSYGKTAFYASFFLRNHQAQLATITEGVSQAVGIPLGPLALLGPLLGLMLGVSGGLGVVIGGIIADRAGRSDPRAYMTAPAIAAVVQIPFFIAALYAADFWVALGLLCIPALLTAFWFGPIFAVIVGLAEPQRRASAGALLQLIVNIIGLGLGPLAVGVISAALGPAGGDGASLRTAMAVCSVAGAIAAMLFVMARRHIRADLVS